MITISENTLGTAIEECTVVGSFFDRVQAGRWLREHPEYQNDTTVAWWKTDSGRAGFANAAEVVKW